MSFDTRLKAPDKDKIPLQKIVNHTKTFCRNRWELLSKNLVLPSENFENLEDFKSLTELKNEH